MVLTQCSSCNTSISDSSMKCPSCGHQLVKPERTIMGKLVKWIFILFNLFMIFIMIISISVLSPITNATSSFAEQVDATLVNSFLVMMVLMVWAIGDIIIGFLVLFTRPK